MKIFKYLIIYTYNFILNIYPYVLIWIYIKLQGYDIYTI